MFLQSILAARQLRIGVIYRPCLLSLFLRDSPCARLSTRRRSLPWVKTGISGPMMTSPLATPARDSDSLTNMSTIPMFEHLRLFAQKLNSCRILVAD